MRGTVELECGGASMGGVLDGWRQSRYLHSPDLQREIVNEMSVGRGEKGPAFHYTSTTSHNLFPLHFSPKSNLQQSVCDPSAPMPR